MTLNRLNPLIKNATLLSSRKGAIRDEAMQKYYAALVSGLKEGTLNTAMLAEVLDKRADLVASPPYFSNLIARATQHTLRTDLGVTDYAQFSKKQWGDVLPAVFSSQVFKERLTNGRTATTKVQRYRTLSALMVAVHHNYDKLDTRNGINSLDFAASVNIGQPAAYRSNGYLNRIPYIDLTKGKVVQTLIQRDGVYPGPLSGAVDIQPLTTPEDIEWFNSCAYFSSYTQKKTENQLHLRILHDLREAAPLFTGDVTSPDFPETIRRDFWSIKGGHRQDHVHLAHTSIFTYQLLEKQKAQFYRNVAELLEPGGVFLEIKFRDQHNWHIGEEDGKGTDQFRVGAFVQFNEGNHKLSEPLELFCWDDPNCRTVAEGRDFDVVADALNLKGKRKYHIPLLGDTLAE